MKTYVILRRNGFASPKDLEAAAARSTEVGKQMAADVSWIRTYALAEESGQLGTICVYQATSEDKLREHADCAKLPVDEIIAVADTVIVRPDPE